MVHDHGVLRIRITDDFELDAGAWHTAKDVDRDARFVAPPSTPLIDQLITYLERLPDPGFRRSTNEAGVALAALTVRFGSYYAVLADPAQPLWKPGGRRNVSLIADTEMMRINIEASYALSRLIEIYYNDLDRYWSVLRRAVTHLPLYRQSAKRTSNDPTRVYLGFATESTRAMLKKTLPEAWRADCETVARTPLRVIANAMINGCWRNGPIEDVHSGSSAGPLPLRQCRVSKQQDRRLFAAFSDRLVHASWALFALFEGADRNSSLVEKATPFYLIRRDLSTYGLAAPDGWSREDSSAAVCLSGLEPELTGVPQRGQRPTAVK